MCAYGNRFSVIYYLQVFYSSLTQLVPAMMVCSCYFICVKFMYEIRSNILGKRKRKDSMPQDVVNDALRKRMLIISKLVENSSAFYPIKFRIIYHLPS